MIEANLDNLAPQKKSGHRWTILILGALVVVAVVIKLAGFMISSDAQRMQANRLQAKAVINDLRQAILAYQVDYNRYPIPPSALSDQDLSIRSRGLMLPWLIGNPAAPQNGAQLPPKDIVYIRLPEAQNRLSGTWQDGEEQVLSDPWGEPYYIVLDTNGDHKISNPEFGARSSDPKQAEFDLKHPQPEMLPVEIIIYSSGPDRDPKTWKDNVCSWVPR